MTKLDAKDRAVLLNAADYCDEWAQICRNSDTILATGKFVDAESKAEHDGYVRTAKRLRKIAAKARAVRALGE